MHWFRKARSSDHNEVSAMANPRALLLKHRLKDVLHEDHNKVITLKQEASVEQALRVRLSTFCFS